MALDFQHDVVERSREVPVVVDFWAAWCGPCRVLGPVIERLAGEAAGRWELVKVDTERHPELAAEYGIMGIPAVKLFHAGQVVAEFTGALPEPEIRRWLDGNLPDPRAGQLAELMRQWETRGRAIAPDLERLVERHPDLAAARVRLAQVVVSREPSRARELLTATRIDSELVEPAADVTALADLVEWRDDGASPRSAPHLEAARKALAEHDLEGTLQALVDAAMADKRYGDELARRAAVALFRLLGHDHPLTREHQARLAMVLHS